jgi:hypothetical protein
MEFKFIRNGWLGFYSDALRMLMSYMVCKKEGTPFTIDSREWIFTHDKGWHDYFTTLQESEQYDTLPQINWDKSDDRQFTVADYKQAMKEIFIYQPYLHEMAEQIIKQHTFGEYTAVFMRRGDKLLGESVYIPTEAYAHLAISTNPSVVFVQTDDYRCVEELAAIIHRTHPSIRIVSTCPPNKHGHFVFPVETSEVRTLQYKDKQGNLYNVSQNVDYLNATTRQKPLIEFTKDEIKLHVEEMLVGMILCQRANYLVIDHTSNVGRYLHFTHPGGRNALKIIEDLNILVAPETRLLPQVSYRDEEYITNPRYHCIHNNYR